MESYSTNEKIYSLATPFSPAALAIIRLSGDGTVEALSKLFSRPKSLLKAETNTLMHGFISDLDGEKIDEVVLAIYREGHGYTSEEAVEITLHGSLPAIKRMSRALESAGFRQALPGEFTFRAFMHGRMDLTEAEAVEEIVKAKSVSAQSSALDRLTGSLSEVISGIKDKVLDVLASLEVQLDYAEDEILEDWEYPFDEMAGILIKLRRILGTYSSARLYAEGATVVLAGKTNAGKSSLFNALLKENRAIVSSEEGTTRDFIEAMCDMDGLPIRLYDTAGLRETEGEIEREGIKRSRELMDRADLILYITDGTDPFLPEEDERTIIVRSKLDLYGNRDGGPAFSSKTGEGLGDVIALIRDRLIRKDTVSDVPQIESERQKEAIERVIEIIEESMEHTDESVDIMAIYFQEALRALSVLTGEVSTEDVLEKLFSQFCLGK